MNNMAVVKPTCNETNESPKCCKCQKVHCDRCLLQPQLRGRKCEDLCGLTKPRAMDAMLGARLRTVPEPQRAQEL